VTITASGAVSFSQIATELAVSSTGVDIGHPWVRQLAGQSAGATGSINVGLLHGKSGRMDGSIFVSTGSPNVIIFNAPFFGTTANGCAQYSNQRIALAFNAIPNWVGRIKIKNNTTGASAIMTQNAFPNQTIWEVTPSDPNILINRAGDTDSFTFTPSV
jgi:hypothetical protein